MIVPFFTAADLRARCFRFTRRALAVATAVMLVAACERASDATSAGAEAQVAESAEDDHAHPERLVVKGFVIGMSAIEVQATAEANGWTFENTDQPATLKDEKGVQIGSVRFGPDNLVAAFSLADRAFNAGGWAAQDFAQAIADNYSIAQLSPVGSMISNCEVLRGLASTGEIVSVTTCLGSSTLSVQAGPVTAPSFN